MPYEDSLTLSATAFDLPAQSLKVLHRAVSSLAKLGREAALIFRPEELVLHGADDSHSAAMQFAFRRRFFSAMPRASGRLQNGMEARLVVASKALLTALPKGPHLRAVDCLSVGLSPPAEVETRLIVEFSLPCGRVRHRVPLLDANPSLPGDHGSAPNKAALGASLLARVLDHCSPPSRNGGCEEVTLSAIPDEGLRIRSFDLLGGGASGAPAINSGGAKQTNRTEVIVQKSDLQACSLASHSSQATFGGRSLRDFAKATDDIGRHLETLGLLDGMPFLELAFGAPEGGPVVCRMVVAIDGVVRKIHDVDAVLIASTKELSDDGGSVGLPATPAVAASAASVPANVVPTQQPLNGRKPQPRQGSKRRAVAMVPQAEAFNSFPDHTENSQATAPVSLRTEPAASTSTERPLAQLGLRPQSVHQSPGPRQHMESGSHLQQEPQQPLSSNFQRPLQALQQQPLQQPQQQQQQQQPQQQSHLQQRRPSVETHQQQPPPQPQQQSHLNQAWEFSSSAPATISVPASPSGMSSSVPPTLPAPLGALPPQAFTWQQQQMQHHVQHQQPQIMQQQHWPPNQQQNHLNGSMPTGCATSVGAVAAPSIPPGPAAQMPPAAFSGTAIHAAAVSAAAAQRPVAVLASQLRPALNVPDDSDDELIGADPDEVAFGVPLGPRGEEDSVDWFDVAKLW